MICSSAILGCRIEMEEVRLSHLSVSSTKFLHPIKTSHSLPAEVKKGCCCCSVAKSCLLIYLCLAVYHIFCTLGHDMLFVVDKNVKNAIT